MADGLGGNQPGRNSLRPVQCDEDGRVPLAGGVDPSVLTVDAGPPGLEAEDILVWIAVLVVMGLERCVVQL